MLLTKRPSQKNPNINKFNLIIIFKISCAITQSPYFKLIDQKYKSLCLYRHTNQWQQKCLTVTTQLLCIYFFYFYDDVTWYACQNHFFLLLLFAIWNFIPSSHEKFLNQNFWREINIWNTERVQRSQKKMMFWL